MRDTILTAIDEAMGESSRCECGKELLLGKRDDALWLQCPTFAEGSWLPGSMATFVRSFTHGRRIVAALPSAPAIPVQAARAVSVAKPAAVRG